MTDQDYIRRYIDDRSELIPETGCWLWLLALKPDGYGVATLDGKYIRAHRLSYIAYHGEIPDDSAVCHHCDVRSCVNPDHLYLGSAAENSADMVRRGRSNKGERHWCSKLTEDDVAAIRASDDSHRVLARRFAVSHGTIGHIKAGTTW